MSLRRAARSVLYTALGSFALSCGVHADDAAPKEAPVPLVAKVYQVADLVLPLARSSDSSVEPDFESLIDLIELKTGADCWSEEGGHGSINPHKSTISLVIRQTHAVHEHIAELLDEIRGTGELAICADVMVVHGDLNACENDRKSQRSAEGLVDAVGKERLIHLITAQKGGSIRYTPKVTFFNGQSGSIEIASDHGVDKIHLRGVISKDNRYTRLWVDTDIAGQSSNDEVLVPEGHTTVRKLPGENSWLLVTSHVINAEEPERIAPTKAHPPAVDQKRYLVPVDDTPDPAELTVVPEFKAQAHEFGLEVAGRVHPVSAEHSVCESGDEKACAAASHQPGLAPAIEFSEYKVAMAEPRVGHIIGQAPDPKTLIGFAMLEDSSESPSTGMLSIAPARASDIGRREVVHGFSIQPENDPPARLDVDLDESLWQDAAVQPVAVSGQLCQQLFTQSSGKVFPLPPGAIETMRAEGHVIRLPSCSLQLVPEPQRHVSGLPRRDLSSPKPYPRPDHTVVVEPHATPRLHVTAPPATNYLFYVQGDAVAIEPAPHLPRVTPAAGESAGPASATALLRRAADELRRLGLGEESSSVMAVIERLSLKARERNAQIDLEIARLMAEKERLEALTRPAGATQPSNEVVR